MHAVFSEFRKIYVAFCEATPIHGFQYMVREDISKYERWIWTIIIIIFISLMTYSCVNLYIGFYENPSITTLEDTHYPISNVALPGIGICSNNKMSLRRVSAFIDELAPRFNQSKQWFWKQMVWLGNMYAFDLTGADQRIEFQDMLDELMQDSSNDWIDMRDILRKISDCLQMTSVIEDVAARRS